MTTPQTHRLLVLSSRLIDNAITEEEFSELELLLCESHEAREIYLQCVDQEVELEVQVSGSPLAARSPVAWRRPAAWLAAAAAVVVLLLLWRPWPPAGDPRIGDGPPPAVEGQEPAPAPPRRRVPPAPESWVARFESGLPPGWMGEWVQADLPDGSRGAARTVERRSGAILLHNLEPPMAFGSGYFSVHDDTRVHLTFKMEGGTWCDVFLMTHVPDPNEPPEAMYKFSLHVLEAQDGLWRRATIPISSFDKKNFATGQFSDSGAPRAGEVAYQLFLSAANSNLSMTVDEIRVDREGPGVLLIERLE